MDRPQSLEVWNFSLESCQVLQAESGVERPGVYREHSSVSDQKRSEIGSRDKPRKGSKPY